MTAEPSQRHARFATTRWSVVLAAAADDAPTARAALADLCAAYWYPLYGDARRSGVQAQTAADLVQGFFAALIEKDWVASADPERGRFRAFLLTAFRRFVGKVRDKEHAQRRGGGKVVTFDVGDAESRFRLEPADTMTPEREYERRFALTLLARAIDATRAEFLAAGREREFAAFLPLLGGSGDVRPYADIAVSLGMTEGAVKVAVHRLRARHRERLRAEVREVVASDADVDEEIRHLITAVAGG
ncbi:MAG: sigma-70 family RNA polymerase sigma factor [Planctomycetota bacterium]